MYSTEPLFGMFEVVVVLVGVILLLKKVADMDGYHKLRVVVMTVILCVAGIWVVDRVGVEAAFWGRSDCVLVVDDYLSLM